MLPSQHTVFTRENFDQGGALLLLRKAARFIEAHDLNNRVAELVDASLCNNPTLTLAF